MMPDVVSRLPAANRARFELAYDNARQRPIGWWEQDDLSVGLVQAWLFALGEKLPKSTKVDSDGSIEADGIFGQETFDAVVSFQRKHEIKADGMVGHDTLDAFRDALRARMPKPANTQVFVKKPPHVFPKPCPPGALICADPDAKPF
jgi:murein L,D-transpeptidase YcbB/YkuD